MRMVSLNRGWLSTGGPFRKSTKRLAHQNSLILRNPSVTQKLTVVTRDHLVAALLTPKTDKVSHFEEELWIKTNYFTSCDPHHDIYTFCYWQIFWHSIWHIFWHSIWHIFWHSVWHIFWHIIYSNLLAFCLANILALYLAYLLAFYLTFYLAFYLAYLLAFYLAYLLTFYLAYLLALYLAYLIAFYLAYLLAFYLTFYLAYLLAFYLAFEVQRCALSSEGPRLRSSGAHWARQVPGWGPAVRTELGRSQVEVQRCALSWEGPRLRSSSARWAPKLAKSLAKSWQGNSARGSGGRGGRRGGGRGGGEGGGRRRRRTTLIKSNNPHLAGGEQPHISWLTWTWRKITPQPRCGHPCRPLLKWVFKNMLVGNLDEQNPTIKSSGKKSR